MPGSSRISVLEYARFHGIARDHLAVDPYSYLQTVQKEGRVQPLPNPENHVPLCLERSRTLLSERLREKLNIHKAGVVLLEAALKSRCDSPSIDCGKILSSRHRIANIKQEAPLLRTDHENDMHVFQDKLLPEQHELKLPLSQLDEENDEGATFPTYILDLPAQLHEQIAKEKLDCTREILRFVKDVRAGNISPQDGDFEERLPKRPKIMDREPLTPPHLPRAPTLTPFIPSSPCMALELLSIPDTPEIREHSKLKRALSADADLILDESLKTGSSDSPCTKIINKFVRPRRCATNSPPSQSCLGPKKRRSSLKVEGPLTPPISVKKRRPEETLDLVNEMMRDISQSTTFLPFEDNFSGFDHLLHASSLAKVEIESKLANERVRGVPSDARIDPPTLPEAHSRPPWLLAGVSGDTFNPSKDLLVKLKTDRSTYNYSQMTEEDEMSLSWNPFLSGISRIQAQELVEDYDLSSFLVRPEEGSLKDHGPVKLRRAITEDDLLSPVIMEEVKILEAGPSNESPVTLPDSLSKPTPSRLHSPTLVENETFKQPSSTQHLFASDFSTVKCLSNFMSIRGKAKPTSDNKPTNVVYTAPRFTPSAIPTIEPEPKAPDFSLSIPDIYRPVSNLTFVVSTSLLRTHQPLIAVLESLPHPITIVFRDYCRMAKFQTHIPGEGPQIQMLKHGCESGSQRLEDDADVVVSPTTAIIFTTAQETTQLYLPGHSPRLLNGIKPLSSPLQERISRVCTRYEQLYVLICHPFGANDFLSTEMDELTLESVRSTILFCASLAPLCVVTPIVIPSVGNATTAWVINLAKKHATATPWSRASSRTTDLISPSEDPTVWEVLLRLAGLNCFAALVVLLQPAEIPSQEASDSESQLRTAFSRFVTLLVTDRLHIYGPLIGHGLVSKTNTLLDAEW